MPLLLFPASQLPDDSEGFINIVMSIFQRLANRAALYTTALLASSSLFPARNAQVPLVAAQETYLLGLGEFLFLYSFEAEKRGVRVRSAVSAIERVMCTIGAVFRVDRLGSEVVGLI